MVVYDLVHGGEFLDRNESGQGKVVLPISFLHKVLLEKKRWHVVFRETTLNDPHFSFSPLFVFSYSQCVSGSGLER